ncbi:hypothetical protein B0H13DRAFT_2342261 [Mycena leptocephala]|nr:hypothetical protein B0H13DRAFT_2342261 [Mycena leptocephala]
MDGLRSSKRTPKPSARALAASDSTPSTPDKTAKKGSSQSATITQKHVSDAERNDSEDEFDEKKESKEDSSESEGEKDLDDSASKRRKKAHAGEIQEPAEPVEITGNISLYSSAEMLKPANKRHASASSIMTFQCNVSYAKFDRALMQKIARLARLVVPPENDEIRAEFHVPRHVKNYVELYDIDDFKSMVRSAQKCKDPTVNIAVSLMQEDEKDKHADNEAEEAVKKKNGTRAGSMALSGTGHAVVIGFTGLSRNLGTIALRRLSVESSNQMGCKPQPATGSPLMPTP